MRRPRPSRADEWLEWWARWLVAMEIDDSTGDSLLSRLKEPRSGRPPGSRPLYNGIIHHIISQLDAKLALAFNSQQRLVLATLYGTPGPEYRVAPLPGFVRADPARLETARATGGGDIRWRASRMGITGSGIKKTA